MNFIVFAHFQTICVCWSNIWELKVVVEIQKYIIAYLQNKGLGFFIKNLRLRSSEITRLRSAFSVIYPISSPEPAIPLYCLGETEAHLHARAVWARFPTYCIITTTKDVFFLIFCLFYVKVVGSAWCCKGNKSCTKIALTGEDDHWKRTY